MGERFRYLRTAHSVQHTSSRKGLLLLSASTRRSLLTICLVFALGITVGFNARDVMIRTCWGKYAGIKAMSLQTMSPKPTGPPPKFTKLPESFLKNITPRNITLNYPLTPHKYTQRLEDGNRYFMTFLIKATTFLVERRFLIRQTWGSLRSINGHSFGVIFVVGNVSNQVEQNLLEKENELYGDLLQTEVPDNYVNLPSKVLSSMQWVSYELGDQSDYYVTTDDDCFVNVRVVYDYFVTNTSAKLKSLHCAFVYDRDARPIRGKSKYHVSLETYPEPAYPNFCHGGMSVMPFDILRRIYQTATVTDLGAFHLEDVLITGILRQKTYNHTENIEAVRFSDITVFNGKPERMVWHLGGARRLQIAFAVRWRKIRAGLNISGVDDAPGGGSKELSARYFTALRSGLPTLPGTHLNQTMGYFSTTWRKLKRRTAKTLQLRSILPAVPADPRRMRDVMKRNGRPLGGGPERRDETQSTRVVFVKLKNT